MQAGVLTLVAVAFLFMPLPARADDPNLGIQAGGPGVIELVFRPRLFEPVRLELGGFAVGGGGLLWSASAGLYADPLRRPGWEGYAAVAGGTAGGCGESNAGPGCTALLFASARVGAAFAVGHDGENRVTVDAGAWYGRIHGDDQRASTFLIPMAGLGFYW